MWALGVSSCRLLLKCKFDDTRRKMSRNLRCNETRETLSFIDLRSEFFLRKVHWITHYFVPKLIRLWSQEKSRVISDSALLRFSTYIHVMCERSKRLVASEAWQWLDLVYLNKFNYGFSLINNRYRYKNCKKRK